MSRLLCYSLRVLQSEKAQELQQDEGISTAESSESGDSSSSKDDVIDGGHGSEAGVDIMKDARRLYP